MSRKNILIIGLLFFGFLSFSQRSDSLEINFNIIDEQRISVVAIEQFVIESDSVYLAIATNPDTIFMRETDFNNNAVLIRNVFTDNRAEIDYKLVYVASERKIICFETITDGGSRGMKFSSFWLLFDKPSDEFVIETITINKPMRNY
ncbi:MAG: hypothetical protein JXR58_02470 [Bacteroidales bacterium]|nr:hypothetical protein [Bacteroidales bacterium]